MIIPCIRQNAAKCNFAYIDNSNLFIEGSRIEAVHRNLPNAPDIPSALRNRVVAFGWNLNYRALYEFACGERSQVGVARIFASSPTNPAFWDHLKIIGYEPHVFGRSAARKEKKVDGALVAHMIRDAFSGAIRPGKDEITLVAGDSDYVPAVELLRQAGQVVHVIFWEHASKELRGVASKFIALDPYHSILTRLPEHRD